MAGVYIHIPFCKQICHYCNFYSLVSIRYRKEFLNALLKEISIQKDYLENDTVETIYFGGGTPSLFLADDFNRIIDKIASVFLLSKDVEITLEANPDDLNRAAISALKNTSINRMSIGVQSFRNKDLNYLNRVHNADQVLSSISEVRNAGFENLSIDLIYGIPTLSNMSWEKNINTFQELDIPHLSAYALTVEPKTALDVLIRKAKMAPVDEEKTVEHFKLLMQKMTEQVYEHYEISNFCKPGFYSQHNTSYWSGEKYLGLGPSAHSFNHRSRQWNIANTSKYIEAIADGKIPAEKEILTMDQRYNEYVLTSLRTKWGTDVSLINQHFGDNYYRLFISTSKQLLNSGQIIKHGNVYYLSKKGMLFADRITMELFI